VHEDGGQNPVWEQSFIFNLEGKEDVVHIHVFNKELVSDALVGRADIGLKELAVDEAKWFTCFDPSNFKKSHGSVLITTKFQLPGVLGAIASATPAKVAFAPTPAPVSAYVPAPAPAPVYSPAPAPLSPPISVLSPVQYQSPVASPQPMQIQMPFATSPGVQLPYFQPPTQVLPPTVVVGGGPYASGVAFPGAGFASAMGLAMGMEMGMGMGAVMGPHYGARMAAQLNWIPLPGSAAKVSAAHKGHLVAVQGSGDIYEMKDGAT